ncbi:hypothetical protein [Rhizobium sp. L1K21]|uniref:hypothetical protein n=1 Tax=Rhizobium sp. L1K21 TaxID=2954933 RepID=UPI0020939CC5|nr:hypothetical protein [Rhizobium sp. L1K21]MCO6188580.1 hypothetical protein [Rhizobium sp. L1K21]
MTDENKSSPLHSPVGGEADVEATAETITPKEITAITISDKPISSRKEALRDMITELEARVDASDRGSDLEPLLEEARNALQILEEKRDEA